jgi:hypothetical protein
VKTGVTLVKTCLESVGIGVESLRVRKTDGSQTREYRPNVMDAANIVERYYSLSKYPWDSVGKYAVMSKSLGFKGRVSDEVRTVLDAVLELGIRSGYYTGPRRCFL